MDLTNINRLITEKNISVDVHAGIKLHINDMAFKAGTVRVMLPVPINAGFLKEGQILDFNPIFRMVSVEDYPQRTAYFNEELLENTDFYIEFAFSNCFDYVVPDLKLIDGAVQKSFSKTQLESYYQNHHCGCESYTGLSKDAVSIMDVACEDFIPFSKERYTILMEMGIIKENAPSEYSVSELYYNKNGTIAREIYNKLTSSEHTSDSLMKNNTRNDIAAEFVALCRICGIPSRWMGGFEIDYSKHVIFPHSWSMIYLAPYGWIYADPENGCNEAYRDYFFGNISPDVIPTASRLGGSMYPAKDYDRADPLYNVFGEVEMVPGKTGEQRTAHCDGYGLESGEYQTEFILY